jgi:hypothetical protein
MSHSGRVGRDDEAELLELLGSFGFDRLTGQVYAVLLTRGPLPKRELLAVFARPEAHLDRSLALLRNHRLAGVAYERFRPRYYATDPRLAWQTLSTDLLWSGPSTLSPRPADAKAVDAAVEGRRRLCSELSVVAGRVYRRHLAVLTHREWDALTTEELAQLVCEIVSTARREILAVSKSPRLPQVAAFWTALTSRLSEGARYRRVVDLDEIIAHGLRLVTRDIGERHIELRVLERDRIGHKFYVVDKRYLAVFHDERQPGVRGVGRISTKHPVVWRYHQRFPAYEQAAIPADFVVAKLRESAAAALFSARKHLTETELAWIESLVELGKFSRFDKEAAWSDGEFSRVEARASAVGLVRRNVEGELVFAYPLTEREIRAAYKETLPRRG